MARRKKDIYTVAEAARMLRVHPNTVRAWCAKGKLKASKAGRVWLLSSDFMEVLFGKKGE